MTDQVNESLSTSEAEDTLDTSNDAGYTGGNDADYGTSGGRDFDSLATGEDAPPEQEIKEEPKPEEPRKFNWKGKLNGEEYEDEVDEDTARLMYQKAKAADKVFQEAAAQRKEVEAFLHNAKHNPAALLQHLGVDPKTYAEQYLNDHIMENMMTEEQKRQRAEQQELATYREQQQALQKQQEHTQYQEKVKQAEARLEQELLGVIQKNPISKDPAVQMQVMLDAAKYVAMERALAHQQKREPTLTMENAVNKAMKQYERGVHQFVKSLDGDALIKYLGEDVTKKIREAELKRVRGSAPRPLQNQQPTMQRSSNEPRKTLNEKDFLKSLDNLDFKK